MSSSTYTAVYRYRCETEGENVFENRLNTDGPPTTCINDPGHSVNIESVVIVKKILPDKIEVNEAVKKINNIDKTDVGLTLVQNIKNNYVATTDPGVSNDASDDYSVGSIWLNTTGDGSCWICMDSTNGSAIWKDVSSSSSSSNPILKHLQLIHKKGLITITKNWSDLTWDTEVRKDDVFSHTTGNGGQGKITVNKTGWFRVHCDVSTENLSSFSRTVSEFRITRNDIEIEGSKGTMYNRGSGYGNTTATVELLVNVSSGDIFQVQCRRISSNGSNLRTFPNGCRISFSEIL